MTAKPWLQLATERSFPEPSQWLTAEELRTFQRIKAWQRRQDWLAGRWAAKGLVREYLRERANLALDPAQIEIGNAPTGAPLLQRPLCSEIHISIAHSAGYGLAGLALGAPIGVDLQHIRAVRLDFHERVLSEHERAQLAHHFSGREGVLVFWALKEAAIKAQRTRPTPALREISVTLTEPGQAEISLGTQRLKAQWGRWGEFIWAWALTPLTSSSDR